MTTEELIEYCEHFIKMKHNQTFAIRAGFHDERFAEWGGTRQSALIGKQIYLDSAQATLDDARAGIPLMICEVCEKPISTHVIWCIHCGHPSQVIL